MSIQVKAKLPEGKVGFYKGLRRRNGDVFSVQNEDEVGSWMEKLGNDKKSEPAKNDKKSEPAKR